MIKRRKISRAERQAVHDKTGGHCAYCGIPLEIKAMQVDHVQPLYNGGADTLNNMLPACRSCNHYKSTCSLGVFRASIQRMPDVLMRDSVTYRNAVRYGLVVPNVQPVVFYFERKQESITTKLPNGYHMDAIDWLQQPTEDCND